MSEQATGSFDVKFEGEPPFDTSDGATLARARIEKQFRGDLGGTSVVNMLSASTYVDGSAGYVAIERVTGSLRGKTGSFVLQHSGIMDRGEQSLTVTVVPDTGTGELAGLTGSMRIDIVGSEHRYTFDYDFK